MSDNDDNSDAGEDTPETPANMAQEVDADDGPELAGRGRRLGAYIIDAIIAAIVLAVFAFQNLGISFDDLARDSMTQQMSTAGTVAFVIIFMAINSYLLVTRGQTLGKWMLGIRIVDVTSNGAATAVKLLGLRYVLVMLLGAIPIIGGLLGVIDFLFIFREDRRCVHDLIAGTKVVSNP